MDPNRPPDRPAAGDTEPTPAPSWQAPAGAPPSSPAAQAPYGSQPYGSPAYGSPYAAQPARTGTQRPTEVFIAGVLLLVLGVIGVLISLLIFAGGAMISGVDFSRVQGGESIPAGFNFGAVFGIVGALVLVLSVAYVLGGVGSIRGREWGRVLGLVVAVIGVLFWLVGLLGSVNNGRDNAGGLVFALILFAVHGYVLWALGPRWSRWPRSA